MKTPYIKNLLALWLFICVCLLSKSQTTLDPGDIAIIGVNMDGNDTVAFLLLKDISTGTEIKFTDNGWLASGAFRGGEGTDVWTAPNNYSSGTVLVIPAQRMKLSSSGDQVIAYQGDDETPSLLFALNCNSTDWQSEATSSNASSLPAGLINGETAVAVTEKDNTIFNSTLITGTRAELLAAICDASNWIGSNSSRYTMAFSNFTVNSGIDATPPLSNWVPENASTGVLTTTDIRINFNEAVFNTDGSEITNGNISSLINFKLNTTYGAEVPFTATIGPEKNLVTITPNNPLAYEQEYYVAIDTLEDASGNETEKVDSIKFTTMSPTAQIIELSAPVGGEIFYAGKTEKIQWASSNVNAVDIKIYNPNFDVWATLFTGITNNEPQDTVIPASAEYGTSYKVAVINSEDHSISDTSDNFTIVGIAPINKIQSATNGIGESLLRDDILQSSGIVAYSIENEGYYLQDGKGPWSGIFIEDPVNTPTLGDSVYIIGQIQENHGVTQMGSIDSVAILETGKSIAEASIIKANSLGESMESVLAKVVNAEVIELLPTQKWFKVKQDSDTLIIDGVYYAHNANLGESLTLEGFIGYSFNSWNLRPRRSSDILSANDTIIAPYTVNNTTNYISNIPYSADLASFRSVLNAPDSGSFDIYDADSTNLAGMLDNNKLVIVTAADGITKRIYKISINNAASSDATLKSDKYTINNLTDTISGIPFGTGLMEFKQNIALNYPEASYVIYQADTTTLADTILSGYLVKVTAEDASTMKYYTLMLIPGNTKASLFSATFQVDQTKYEINKIPDGISLDYFMANVSVSEGAKFAVYQSDGHTPAYDIKDGYKVVVTAQDRVNTSTYTLSVLNALKDLIISEYIEGTRENRALEILNPNNVDIALSNYLVTGTSNASDTLEHFYPFPPNDTIRANDVYVIVHNNAKAEMKAVADWVTATNEYVASFNGNDSRGIAKRIGNDTVLMDLVGNPVNPGKQYYSIAGTSNAMVDKTVLRKATITTGNTNWPVSAGSNVNDSEWVLYGIDFIGNLGKPTEEISDNASLKLIVLGNDTLEGFNPEKFGYNVTYPDGIKEIPVIKVTPSEEGASIKIDTAKNLSGTTEERTTTITVTAEDGFTQLKYTITYSLISSDASLSNLMVDRVSVTGFTPTDLKYSLILPVNTTEVPTVSAIPTTDKAKLELKQATTLDGSPDDRTALVKVIAEDGITILEYSILFSLKTSSNNNTDEETLKVYPTLVNAILSIENCHNVEGFEIYNLLGAQLLSIQTKNQSNVNINLSTLQKGSYLLRLKYRDDIKTFKFIKN